MVAGAARVTDGLDRKVVALNELVQAGNALEALPRKERTVAFLQGEYLDALLGVISANVSLRDACKVVDIAYSSVQKALTEDPALRPRYEAARTRQAEAIMDEIAELEHKLEFENLDPKAAQVLIGSKQWRAERMNPKRYGPRSFQHIETVDQTALHLEAVRQLARERREALAHQQAPGQQLPPPVYVDAEVLPASDEGVDR